MIYEGLVDEARKIVRMARSRYDGRAPRRPELRSRRQSLQRAGVRQVLRPGHEFLVAADRLPGPGARRSARASSASSPDWQPGDHRSFFTAPRRLGSVRPDSATQRQTARIEVRYGRLALRQPAFELPDTEPAAATLQVGERFLAATLHRDGHEVRLLLEQQLDLEEADVLEVTFM